MPGEASGTRGRERSAKLRPALTPSAGLNAEQSGAGVLPNFLVIGAQRAGTTLLHGLLKAHPDVYVPGRRKEVHYFDRYFDRGEAWYRGFFPTEVRAGEYAAIGEATPDYLALPPVTERIARTLPRCRFVAVLRNPVDRAYSYFLHVRRTRNERRPFHVFLEEDPTVLSWGLYGHHIDRFERVFGRDSVHVMLLEELIARPREEMAALARFLHIGESWPSVTEIMRVPVNRGASPRFRSGFALARRFGGWLYQHDLDAPVHFAKRLGIPRLFGDRGEVPPLDAANRKRLVDYYEPDIRVLGALLGRDLAAWRI